MKKFFSIFLLISIFFSQNFLHIWKVFAEWETWLSAQFSWNANSFENVKKFEFILDLKWSTLEKWIVWNKKRLTKKHSDNWYDILSVSNINKYEEKLVLRLTWKNKQYIDFVNFNTNQNVKKFHDIALIKHNWKIKAKVVVYVHKNIDSKVYNVLWWENSLVSAKYLYFWIKNWKPYKKARVIKIN
jgi:hypothetical protein